MPDASASPSGGRLPFAGLLALAAGTLLIGLIHVLPAADGIDPVARTISEYGRSPAKWIFDVAVLLVGSGSALVFGALVRQRRVRAFSVTTVFGAVWVLGLATVVVFQKTDWSVGPTFGSLLHRYGSIVAFVCLPLAVFAAAKAAYPESLRGRVTVRVFAGVAYGWLGVIIGAVVLMAFGGDPWWRAIPLGLVERLLCLSEVLAIASLAFGLRRAPVPEISPELVRS